MAKDKKEQLPEDTSGVVASESVENAGAVVEETTEVVASESVENADLVWVRVLLPLAGKFLMPHDPDAEILINKNQAIEIVESGYGEFIDDKSTTETES